ncbi:MAG: hypothetical protein FJX56_01555 [Alphaproteobacteria bacterium]|nr:hypothetical protein [Alphaproteobacteria bacterium]
MASLRPFLLAAALALLAPGTRALELDPDVPPELSLGGRLLATPSHQATELAGGGSDQDSLIDISDSALLINAAKYLYRDLDYGFATFGLVLPDDDSDFEDGLFVHQLFVGTGGPAGEVLIGRTNLPNTLVQLPTIRDDDLLDYSHVANAHLNAEGEEFQVYGGLLSGTAYFGAGRWSLGAALTARAETDLQNLADPERTSTNAPNGGALALRYELPAAVKFDRGLRFAGLLLDVQRAAAVGAPGEHWIPAAVAGLAYNLSEDPEASWVVHAQGLYVAGEDVGGLASAVERAPASRYALAGALTYAARPFLQTRWQAGVAFAWRDFTDRDEAYGVALVPSFAYRLGSGIDLVGQYRFEHSGDGLAAAIGADTTQEVLIGLTFALSGTFNESVGQRGSILELEHDILNPGPATRAH